MRIATLNLWGRRGAWDERRAVLVTGFSALQPDLVAFQEAIRTDEYDQARDLLGPGFQIVHQAEREPDGQGIAIASRWPIGKAREVDLRVTPKTAGFACTTLIAEIAAPEPIGPLVFVNHLPNWQLQMEYERELQAVAAAWEVEVLAGHGARHAVLAGDFDADPARPACASGPVGNPSAA